MKYEDQTKSRRNITAFDEDVIFAQLIDAATGTIHALKVFYEVGTQIRVRESYKYPSCQIRPLRAESIERHLSGMREWNDYIVNPVFLVKHPNDSIVTQRVLYLAKKVKRAFDKSESGSGPFVYASITGHFDTKIVPIEIEPLQLMNDNGLAFNSGINIVFSVWETL